MKLGTAARSILGVGSLLALAAYRHGRAGINRHVADYASFWAERGDGGKDALRYVALGDSAAQGVGASHVSQGYVPRLGRRLAEATGRDVVITNLSVSGATSDDVVRDQLPLLAALSFTPDVVTLDIGANDVVFPGHTPSTFTTSFDQILKALPPGSFVGDVPWFALPVWGRQSREMAGRAARLIERHGHHLVPLHQASRAAGLRLYHRYTARDLFHPNDLGYEGWADTFWAVMEDSAVVETLSGRPS